MQVSDPARHCLLRNSPESGQKFEILAHVSLRIKGWRRRCGLARPDLTLCRSGANQSFEWRIEIRRDRHAKARNPFPREENIR